LFLDLTGSTTLAETLGEVARHGDSGGFSCQTETSGIRLVKPFRSTSWRQVGR
jgi:hypothetical protein